MAKQQDNLVVLDFQTGRNALIGPDNSIAISKDLEVGGNLTVLGTMSYIDSEILTSDNYLFMNSEYTATSARKGGLIINSKIDSGKRGTLFSATASTNKIVIVGTTSFASGDIIAIVGSTDKLNDGIYEVSASTAFDAFKTEITLKSSVTSGFEEMFKVSVVDESQVTSCVVGLCTLSVLRSDPVASAFESGFGTNTGGITFQDIAGSGSSLQTAYDSGTTISMTSADGAFSVSPASGQSVGFSLTGGASSEVKTSGANTLDVGTDSGALTLSSGTGNITASTASTSEIKLITGASETGSAVFGRLKLASNVVSLTANGASSSLSLTSSHGAVSLASNASTVSVLSNDVMTLTSIGNTSDIDIVSGREFTVVTGQNGSSIGKIEMTATNGPMSLTTTSGGDLSLLSDGDLSAQANGGSLRITTTDGPITLTSQTGSKAGEMTLTSQETIDVLSAKKLTLASNAGGQTILISSVGTHSTRAFAGSSSTVHIDADSLDMDSESFSLESSASSSSNVIQATGSNSSLSLSSTAALNLTSSGNDIIATSGAGIHLKSTQTSSGDLILMKNSSNSGLLLVSEERVNTGRTLVIGDDVTTSGAIMGGTSVPKQTGAGLRVTADFAVSVGEILAIDANGRFGKAKAGRATENATQLPQNPIGVALANGQSSQYTDMNISTVTGTVVLVQFDGTPSASDLGMPVFLSDTNGKAGTSMPASNNPADGLIRVTQVGTLLSITATTASDYTGSNVNLYPVLWNVDYIVDK